MHLVVFSICKDEEKTIAGVLDAIPPIIPGIDTIQTLVLSDGSLDRTAEVARNAGATVIEGQTQLRLAARFQQAIDIALAMGADIAVNIDGDLQFDPAEIPKLVEPIVSGRAQFVAGDRFTKPGATTPGRPENMPKSRYAGNVVGAGVVSLLTGTRFPDVTCGFRAYSREAMLTVNINSTYTYTQESFQRFAHAGLAIEMVPIAVTYYPGRRSRVVEGFVSFVSNSAVNLLRSYRDMAPLRFFAVLALLPLLGGLGGLGFVLTHWLRTSQTSPYTSIGLLGGYFFSLGVILIVVGLVADMMVRSSRNQEKILRLLKEERYQLSSNERYGLAEPTWTKRAS